MIDLCVDIETTGTNFFDVKDTAGSTMNPEDQIIAIGYKNDQMHGSFIGDEKEILPPFLKLIDKLSSENGAVRIVGYNVKSFDVPFIFYKCIKHDLGLGSFKHIIRGMKDWNNPYIFDLYAFLSFKIFKNNFALKSVLKSFGLEGKYNDISGQMAKGLSPEELKSYVEKDVEIEWELYKKLIKFDVII